MDLGYPLFLALVFACLTAQWWESRISDYINLFLHRCHLILQLSAQHSNIFLGCFSLTTVSSQWGADEPWQTFITSLRWYQLPHQSWSQLHSSALNGLHFFLFARIWSRQGSLTLINMSLSLGTCTWLSSDLLVISLAFLVGILFWTHATILLLVMWLFSASLRESLWAKEHSYYFCNYWHQVITQVVLPLELARSHSFSSFFLRHLASLVSLIAFSCVKSGLSLSDT